MLKRYLLLLCLIVISTLSAVERSDSHHLIVPLVQGKKSVSSYFDSLGMDDVYTSSVCRKGCSGQHCCYPVIKNAKHQVLYRYGSGHSLTALASGRYDDVAYLLYRHSYSIGNDYYNKTYLVDAAGTRYIVPPFKRTSSLAIKISKDRHIVQVFSNGVYKDGRLQAGAKGLVSAKIANEPEGALAVVAVDDSRSVMVSNMSRWKYANIILSEHSDTGGILAVYPKDSDVLYLSVYNRINVYNKGLMGAVVDFKGDEVHSGWIANSAAANIGFDPEIYLDKDSVIVAGQNSSSREHVYLEIAEPLFQTIDTYTPQHIIGFENEPFMGFLAGIRLSKLSWVASSKVEPDSVKYAEVDYDIGDSLYKSLYLEGKIGSVDLAITYLRGEAQEKGGLTSKASKALDFVVDFNQLFSASSTLRVKLSDAKVNGVATFHTDFDGLSFTPNGTQKAFSSRLKRFSVLNMMERGWYFGGEYSSHITPSAVGFSNSSKSIERVALDDAFKIRTYEFVFGYDEISYARRYETDMSRFYIQAMGGVGVGVYTLSSQTRQDIEKSTAKKIDDSTYSFALDGSVDVGYIYQQRFKAFRGLGYSMSAGYHLRGSLSGMGQSNKSETDADSLILEMSRYDLWHGPYVSLNIIY